MRSHFLLSLSLSLSLDNLFCALANSIHGQRKEYEKFIQNKPTPLNADRIAKLEALGFEWKLRQGRPKKGDKAFRNKRMGVGYDNNNKKKRSSETSAVKKEEEDDDDKEAGNGELGAGESPSAPEPEEEEDKLESVQI